MAKLEGIKLNEGNGNIYFNGKTLPLTDFTYSYSNGRQTNKLLYGSMNNNTNEEQKNWNATLVLVEENIRDVLEFADNSSKGSDFTIVWEQKTSNDNIRYTFTGCLLNDESVNLQATSGGTLPISGTFKKKKIS